MSYKIGALIIALFFCANVLAAEDITTSLMQSKSWLMPALDCPADVLLTKVVDVTYDKNKCKGQETACLSSCKEGDVNACYNAALEIQSHQDKKLEKYSEALFLKSCKLGALSGCTNRAAGIESDIGEKKSLACAIKTYKKVCDLGDPWACTMYGYHLATGNGIKQDKAMAVSVMANSCKYGNADPACSSAEQLIQKIEREKH